MRPFENFDWTNFWNDSDYAKKAYIGKAPTDEEISEIEKELGYKLPQSYIELIKTGVFLYYVYFLQTIMK